MRDAGAITVAAITALGLSVATGVLIEQRQQPQQLAPQTAPTATPTAVPDRVAADICAALDEGTPMTELIGRDLPVDTAEQARQLLDVSIEKHCPQYLADYRAASAPKE